MSKALRGSCSPLAGCIHRIQLIPLFLLLPGNVITDNVLVPVGVSHGRVISSGTDIIIVPNIVLTLQSISASQSHLCHFNFVSADSADCCIFSAHFKLAYIKSILTRRAEGLRSSGRNRWPPPLRSASSVLSDPSLHGSADSCLQKLTRGQTPN